MPALRVNGHDMAFVERGAGAPLLLVHGTLCDYRHWAAQMAPVRRALPHGRGQPRHCSVRKHGTAKTTIVTVATRRHPCIGAKSRWGRSSCSAIRRATRGIDRFPPQPQRFSTPNAHSHASSSMNEAAVPAPDLVGTCAAQPTIAAGARVRAKRPSGLRGARSRRRPQALTIEANVQGRCGWERHAGQRKTQMSRANRREAHRARRSRTARAVHPQPDCEGDRRADAARWPANGRRSFHHIRRRTLRPRCRDVSAGRHPQRVALRQCRQPAGVRTRGAGLSGAGGEKGARRRPARAARPSVTAR